MILYTKFTDSELLQFLVNGEEGAFTEIYNRYWKKLIALAYSHTRDKFLAEEIVQEVFLSLWNRKETINIQSISPYLGTAVKFSIFKYIYTRNRRESIIKSFISNSSADLPDELVQAKFMQEYINGIVEQLPEKCRMVYRNSREKGLSMKEIAREMSISEKTVEAHLSKALKVIRVNLKHFLMLLVLLRKI